MEIQFTVVPKQKLQHNCALISFSLYPIIYEALSFKEKQALQPKSKDNIKYLYNYYNWMIYRFLRKQFHPHDTKCMSDEMYRDLQ